MIILAMDLVKNNTVFCEYDSKTAKHKFGKVKTTPQQVHELLVEKEPESESVYYSSCTLTPC